MGEEQKRKEEEEVRTKTVNNFSVDKPCDLLPLTKTKFSAHRHQDFKI